MFFSYVISKKKPLSSNSLLISKTCFTERKHFLLNLFCLYSVNDGVEGRRYHHIEVSKENVHVTGYAVTPKTMSKKGEERRRIEQKDDTDVGATCTQSLESCISRRNSKH